MSHIVWDENTRRNNEFGEVANLVLLFFQPLTDNGDLAFMADIRYGLAARTEEGAAVKAAPCPKYSAL